MFPGVALVTPLFQLFRNIGWFGTYQALIIPDISFVLPLTIYTLTAFFKEMPWELEEAAKIDGATPGQAFRKVILPLAAPGLFTTAILAFIASWNEFLIASQLSNDKTQPVTVAIAQFTGSQPQVEPYTAVMAAGTVVTDPADHHGPAVPAEDRRRPDGRRCEGLMPGRDPAAGPTRWQHRVPAHEGQARRQRLEMVLGILGFFTFVALVVTVVAEVRGDPALVEVLVLVFFLGLTYYAYRAWQRS